MKATPRLGKLLDRFEEEIVAKAEKEKARLQVIAINITSKKFSVLILNVKMFIREANGLTT